MLAVPLLLHAHPEEIACDGDQKDNRPHTKKLWEGYEISLGPARNATDPLLGCTAAIYNKNVKVVFRTTGYSVSFDQKWTGQDIDGDGHPEVVFDTDTGGGVHCCWEYNVVSLYPKPHRLFNFQYSGATVFQRDKQGRIVIRERMMISNEFTSIAMRPAAERVWQIDKGEPIDATIDYCAEIMKAGNEDYDEAQRALTPSVLKALPNSVGPPSQEVASALLSRALQLALCDESQKALALINLWPESSRKSAKLDLARAVDTVDPDLAKELRK